VRNATGTKELIRSSKAAFIFPLAMLTGIILSIIGFNAEVKREPLKDVESVTKECTL
jgi:hypothetical protein